MHTARGDEDQEAIEHRPGCHAAQHTDPADNCFTTPVTVEGLSTYVDLTDGIAYSPQIAGTAWTAAGCFSIAARFADLGQHLLRLHS